MQTGRKYLLDFSREELYRFVNDIGLETFRAEQIFKGIYVQYLPDFSALTTISKDKRKLLNQISTLRRSTISKISKSPLDNTTKFLWKLSDGLYIESVIIYEKQRTTLCISSQVGCVLKCKFCATGKMGFFRNLSSGEIIEQVIVMKEYAEKNATNIVFMGMGEPLLNLNNVLKACHVLSDPEGMVFARKKITISTSGVIKGIKKMADLRVPFPIAISLNAVSDKQRQKIMPIAYKYSLKELYNSITYYAAKTKMRVTFEYLLIDGFNTSKADADLLIKFTNKIPCKINLIPYNPIGERFEAPQNDRLSWFSQYLREHHKTVTIRIRKGIDINAACGQLCYEHMKNKNQGGMKCI